MTYKEWESELLGYLKSLPEKEKEEIINYYREIYSDRSDAGMKNEDILSEFGAPMLCAAKILKESAGDIPNEKIDNVKEKTEQKDTGKITIDIEKAKKKAKGIAKNLSVSKIVGWFFIAVLVIIPIYAVIISVIASFAAAAISGAALIIGGAVLAVASPFGLITGYTGSGVLATMGMGLASAGVGAVITVIFFLLTKYSAIYFFKANKYIFRRRDKQ